MDYWREQFDFSRESFPWHDARIAQTESRRAALGDSLLFDILLRSGGIPDPISLYPPSDVESFSSLVDTIISECHFDTLKKACLIYYLLKCYQDGHEDTFRLRVGIPPQFVALADAYWHLDTGVNVHRAVSLLADQRLNRDYSSKILSALSQSGPNASRLVVKYVKTAKPLLTEPTDIDLYALALAEQSLFDAWSYQRTFNEANENRERVCSKILEWCVSPKPRPHALQLLLNLPLNKYEHSVLHTLATKPSLPPTSLAALQDLICVQLIQTGRYAEAIKYDRQFSASTPEHAKVDQMREREKMCREVYRTLPDAEKSLIDAAPSSFSPRKEKDAQLSQSWVDISPSLAQSTASMKASTTTTSMAQFLPLSASVRANGSPARGNLFGKSPAQPLSGVSALAASSSTRQQQQTPSGRSSAPAAKPDLTTFKSASKRPNAFYQPASPPKSANGLHRPLFSSSLGKGASKQPAMDVDGAPPPRPDPSSPTREQPPQDTAMEVEKEKSGGEAEPEPLGFSLFYSDAAGANDSPSVPGGFAPEDEDDGMQEDVSAAPKPPTTRRQSTVKQSRKSATATRRSKRKLPGALDDDDDVDEDDDDLAPLPEPPVTRRGAARKGRGSSVEPDAELGTGTGESVPRRRSSRLSSTDKVALVGAGTGSGKSVGSGGKEKKGSSKSGRKKRT